jgi:hypothetical protein
MRALLDGQQGYRISDRVPDWEKVIAQSVFHLCPRGNGPTSYRMYEALQVGAAPAPGCMSVCLSVCLSVSRTIRSSSNVLGRSLPGSVVVLRPSVQVSRFVGGVQGVRALRVGVEEPRKSPDGRGSRTTAPDCRFSTCQPLLGVDVDMFWRDGEVGEQVCRDPPPPRRRPSPSTSGRT